MVEGSGRDEVFTRGRRWLAVGCGLGLLALVLVLVGGVATAPRLLAQGLALNRQRVIRALSPSVAPPVRERIGRAFDCVLAAVGRDALGENQLASLGQATRSVLADGAVTAEEATALAATLEGLCREAGHR